MRNPEMKPSRMLPNAETAALHKEWDDARCAICMDHPHNAVLLLCSSHDKGCRSYICDTSYRHSNCLDRLRKMHVDNSSSHPSSSLPRDSSNQSVAQGSRAAGPSNRGRRSSGLFNDEDRHAATRTSSSAAIVAGQEEGTSSYNQDLTLEAALEGEGISGQAALEASNSSNQLMCPLCRGAVKGWEIIRDARQYLDAKPRACSREECAFSGTYGALRKHARRVHPATRPADVDPSRRRAWHRLENQREYGDIMSVIRSAMPGAVVFGDYAIDEGEHDEDSSSVPSNSLLRTFFLFHMMNTTSPARSGGEPRVSSSSSRGLRRRYLWGENLLGLEYDEDEEDEEEDEEEVRRPRSRRRRRLVRRSRSEERR